MIHVLDMQLELMSTRSFIRASAQSRWDGAGPCFFVTKLRCRLPGRVLPGMMAFCVRSVLHHSFRNIILFLGFMLITSPSLARIRMSLIRDARSLRLPSKTRTTWTQHTSVTRLESVGCVLDFDRGVIMNKPSRVWRFASATEALLRRRKLNVEILQVWCGHYTALCGITYPLESVIWKSMRVHEKWRFISMPEELECFYGPHPSSSP